MWIWLTICSALLLGSYDVVKKKALEKNGVLYVLLGATALSVLFLCPFLKHGSSSEHLNLVVKALFVTTSWVSGMVGLKLLPITTVSTLKATRPFCVVFFSILLFGEKLNGWQWAGVVLALLSLTMLNFSSRSEGISFRHNRGIWAMVISILSGVASALFDKHIMKSMDPLFVQSWGNFYITILLIICIVIKSLHDGKERERFRWDWRIVLIAVLITAADMSYFFALKQDGALLSVISLVRRSSVIVTFVLGAILFREHKIKEKSISLGILLLGMACLTIGSLQ